MNENKEYFNGDGKQFTECKEVVADSSLLIGAAENGVKVSELPKLLELCYGAKVRITILLSIYREIECMKKSNNVKAKEVYSQLSQIFYSKDERFRYEETPRHEYGVDDTILEYTEKQKCELATLDDYLNIRASSRNIGTSKVTLTHKKFKALVEIQNQLKNIKEGTLSSYLKKILDNKKIDGIALIQMTPKARLEAVINCLLENTLEKEETEFEEIIKNSISVLKTGEISDQLLKKALSELKGYNFGLLIKEEDLVEENAEIIERFLKEKNYSSFEELERSQPFLTSEELVERIKTYYSKHK